MYGNHAQSFLLVSFFPFFPLYWISGLALFYMSLLSSFSLSLSLTHSLSLSVCFNLHVSLQEMLIDLGWSNADNFWGNSPQMVNISHVGNKIAQNAGNVNNLGLGATKLLAFPCVNQKVLRMLVMSKMFGAVGIKKCLKRWQC